MAVTANGRLGYSHRAVFDVRNLDFKSDLVLNAIGLESLIDETEDRLLNQARASWKNRLEYRIGKILMTLSADTFITREQIGVAAFFRVIRSFRGRF